MRLLFSRHRKSTKKKKKKQQQQHKTSTEKIEKLLVHLQLQQIIAYKQAKLEKIKKKIKWNENPETQY